MKTLLYCLLGLLVTFSACEKDDPDACINCDEALHHMGDKIDKYACNPGYMQEAWDAINATCDSGSNMVGYMAETCVLGSTIVPPCGGVLSTAGIEDKVLFKISYPGWTLNDTLYFGLTNDRPYSDTINGTIITDQTISIPYSDIIVEGDYMRIAVAGLPQIKGAIQRFSFNRRDNWNAIRTIYITRDSQTNELILEFVNW